MNEQAENAQGHQDESLWKMMGGSFRGPLGWMAGIAWVYMIGFTVLAVLSAVWFFQADTTQDHVMYATIFLTLALFTGLTKTWYWELMRSGSLRRRLDRLERKIDQLRSGGA